MSKLVCRVAKFKGGQLYGMDIHIQRKTDNHSNKDIDISRSNLNYELVSDFQNQHYFTAVQNRIKDGYSGTKSLRKDATLACGVLISSDKKFFDNLTEEQERDFFQTAYEHLCEKYGKENIISAKVHKDETTPHLHAIVVPLTKDGRLSAKELFDRKALLALQADLPNVLKQRGFDINRGESSNKKHLETAEFKKIRDENKITISINPDEVEPQILKDGLFKKEVEPPKQIAERLTEKYIKPLADEVADLRTELQLKERHEQRILHSRKFQKEQGFKSDFIALYESLKKFGDIHVKNGLERLKSVVDTLNLNKKKELEEQEKLAELRTKQKELDNLSKQYKIEFGGELAQVADYGDAPLNFEKNAEKSFYIVARTLADNKIKQFWGLEFKDTVEALKLKFNDVVEICGNKIHRKTALNSSISQKTKQGGIKI